MLKSESFHTLDDLLRILWMLESWSKAQRTQILA